MRDKVFLEGRVGLGYFFSLSLFFAPIFRKKLSV